MIKVNNNRIDYIIEERVVGNVFFIKENNIIKITSALVEPKERGKGIASKMLEEVFTYFKRNNYKVIIECSYVDKWTMDKKEYQEMIMK